MRFLTVSAEPSIIVLDSVSVEKAKSKPKSPKSSKTVKEKPRTRQRRTGKFLGLNRSDYNPVYRERYPYIDYLSKLNAEQLEWLARELDGSVGGRFYEDGWGPVFPSCSPKGKPCICNKTICRKRIARERSYARVDIYNIRNLGGEIKQHDDRIKTQKKNLR